MAKALEPRASVVLPLGNAFPVGYIVVGRAPLRSKALRLVAMPNAWSTRDEEGAMSRFERQFVLALMILVSLAIPAAAAGPPPNAPPGTICVTPQGWCPAVKRGPPGAPCACQTANGWVQGSLK